jgi:hypothetical protein
VFLVSDGDIMSAKYVDTTLPDYAKTNQIKINAIAMIGRSFPALEQVS